MSQETFERELARRAEDVHGAPFTLADVRTRAHSIRRRRRVAAAGAVAAAVVLVVVVPSLLAGNPAKKSEAPDPAPPVPGHTAALHDGTVALPDGTTVNLPVDNADVTQMGVLTDGRIVLAMQKPYVVRVYDADGRGHTDYAAGVNAITMSAGDDVVAWAGDDYYVYTLASGAAEPRRLHGVPMAGEAYGSIDAVLDAEHVLGGDGTTTTHELTPDGAEELATVQPFRVMDVSPDGTLAVSFIPDAAHEDGGCAGLYDPDTAEITARSCSAYTLRFAPDGQHLLSGYYENNMVGGVRVLDLDLHPVAEYAPEGRTAAVSRVAWADSEHLLAAVSDWRAPSWTLRTVGLDGSSVVVSGPEDGENPEGYAEYVLSE